MGEENNVGVASDFISESQGSKFLKGSDFDSGLDVEVVSMSKITPSNSDFGVKNIYGAGGSLVKQNWFVKEGILEEGQTFAYTFNVDGEEKVYDNSSLSFYFAFTKKNPKVGDKLNIKRIKNSNTDVEWVLTDM